MFTLQRSGNPPGTVRLLASARLDGADFRKIAADLGEAPVRATKTGFVAAMLAVTSQRLETRWNGKESEITANAGDWIVTSLSNDATVLKDAAGHVNTYAIRPDKFAELYEPAAGQTDYGDIYRAKGKETVEAVYFSGGFEIMAPWGEVQRAGQGYLLLNGADVYGNNKETFEATYKVVT